jgi:hypothetical protein
MKKRRAWPLILIAAPASVAIWAGWVGLGGMCGFGIIHPLPGIADSLQLNTAITLPVGVEAYGGYALGVWADASTPQKVRRFAFRSALGSLGLGLLGQVVFHLLSAAGYARAPWPVVVFVSCIPVAALGFGMGLHQLLIHTDADEPAAEPAAPVSLAAAFDELAAQLPPRAASAPLPQPGPAPAAAGEGTSPAPAARQLPKGSQAAAGYREGDPAAAVIRAAASAEQLARDTGITRWRAQQLLRPGSYALQYQLRSVEGRPA